MEPNGRQERQDARLDQIERNQDRMSVKLDDILAMLNKDEKRIEGRLASLETSVNWLRILVLGAGTGGAIGGHMISRMFGIGG